MVVDDETEEKFGVKCFNCGGSIYPEKDTLQEAIEAWNRRVSDDKGTGRFMADKKDIDALPSAQPEEVIPHRNYKYLSDYWCACGWHLGKKGEVKYCADCGRKVNWDE